MAPKKLVKLVPSSPDQHRDKIIKKKKPKKIILERMVKSPTNDRETSEEVANAADEPIDWPEKDLAELIKRMEVAIPENDTLSHATRVEKLNWDEIAFSDYSGEDCKKVWYLIHKRLRRFRLLSELLQDAKVWVSKPWTNFYRGGKTKRHPDMPRRPLSTYMIFYLKKKDKILAKNPGLEMTELSKRIAQKYKIISAPKREKYAQLAAQQKRVYEERIHEFYQSHPDILRGLQKARNKPEPGPKKPQTPFGMYYEDQLKTLEPDADKNVFKEKCKEQWKNMSDKKKVVWIDWAVERETQYQEKIQNYKSQNPDFVVVPVKPVLTKEEKLIKERIAGKPIKPPNSAYSLFSRIMLQSDNIKTITPKERMNAISAKWKTCSEKERKEYRDRVKDLMEQYKLDFASYLETLPEDKREEELQNNLPKRKAKPSEIENEAPAPPPKKKSKIKAEPVQEAEKEENLDLVFKDEPEQPPISDFALFTKTYKGSKPAELVWNTLSKSQKKKYDVEVNRLKQKYIKEYEQFLKTLTKEQLWALSNLRQCKDGGKKQQKKPVQLPPESSDSEDSNASFTSSVDCQ